MTIFSYSNRGAARKFGGDLSPYELEECKRLLKREKDCEGMLSKIGCKFDPSIVGAIIVILAIIFVMWAFSSGYSSDLSETLVEPLATDSFG